MLLSGLVIFLIRKLMEATLGGVDSCNNPKVNRYGHFDSDTAFNIPVAFTVEFSRNSPGFPRGSDRDCASRRRNLLTHTVPVCAALIMCKILQRLVTATRNQDGTSKFTENCKINCLR